MKHYTEAERAALLAEIKYNRENCFCSDKTLELFSVAESALTTPPVAALKFPELISDAVNEAAWLLHDKLAEGGPLTGHQFNNLKGSFYEAMKVALGAPAEGNK